MLPLIVNSQKLQKQIEFEEMRKRQGMDENKDKSIKAWTQYIKGQGGKLEDSLKTERNFHAPHIPTIIHNTLPTKNKALVLSH